jgi:cell division protein FtsW
VGNALTRRLRRGKKKIEASPAKADKAPEATEAAEAVAEDAEPTADAEASTDAMETVETVETAPDAPEADEPDAPADQAPADKAKVKVKDPDGTTRARFGAWLNRPMTSFHLIVAIAGLLTTLGLTMVLSASGVRSYGDDGSAWVIFGKQVLWTIIGVFAAYVAMRVPIRFIRRVAFPGYVVTIILLVLVLVPGIGNLANGSRKWFVVAGFSMQPSELAKIAFAIWGAHLLASRRLERASLRDMLIPLVPAAVIALGLIVAQPDLGQTVSMGIILLALLWYAGLPLRVFGTSLLAVFMAGAVLAMSAGYRSDRVRSWINPENDPMDTGYQARQAKFALAHGGIFGDGLGQGTAKWNYLPNAHNDFIFAIIGEELGFIGAFGLLALFGLFAYTGMRIARRSADPFLRLLTATTTMWILGQAFINIGYVIGVLPVTGLQLPLISAGGTSTAATLFMIGIMCNAARHEPEAVAALRAGRDDKMNRLLRLPLPEPYSPTRLETFRDRKKTQPRSPRPPAPGRGRKAPARKAEPPARNAPQPGARRGARQPEPPLRPVFPRTAARAEPRSRHHGSDQRYASQQARLSADQRQTRRARALEGQRYG